MRGNPEVRFLANQVKTEKKEELERPPRRKGRFSASAPNYSNPPPPLIKVAKISEGE